MCFSDVALLNPTNTQSAVLLVFFKPAPPLFPGPNAAPPVVTLTKQIVRRAGGRQLPSPQSGDCSQLPGWVRPMLRLKGT